MFLDSYQVGCGDIVLSGLSGFSGLPYSIRHWEVSQSKTLSTNGWLAHRIMAVLEALPIFGFIIALIEYLGACFCKHSQLETSDSSKPQKFIQVKSPPIPTEFCEEQPLVLIEHNSLSVQALTDYVNDLEKRGGRMERVSNGSAITVSVEL